MTFPRPAKAAFAAALFLAPAFSPSDAKAAPLTYTFTGTLDSSFSIATSGTLAGLFSVGDTFTLTSTVDQDGPPDVSSFGTSSQQRWYTGNEFSISINGQTFSIGDSIHGIDESVAIVHSNSDIIRALGYDNTANHYSSTGSATSTLSSIDFALIEWVLEDDDILDYSDPRFPGTIDIADWIKHRVNFIIIDFNEFGSEVGRASFSDSSEPVFSSVTSGGGEGVPTPGAIALLGLGLIGLGFRRSRT